jgi:cellulose synthase/poly-beta-1,6-N-acetylglucosamine synthase-like glycosyltransferase
VLSQQGERRLEVLVVNDGSTDQTAAIVQHFPGVRLINQSNAGPAAARNRGAHEAKGSIILFTDDDCVPAEGWLTAMLAPFGDPGVVGAKGVYRTNQSALIARFVQIEYESRYRLMANRERIDFIDTYSAAFRRDRFLDMGGYDTSFPVACAEDIELSYRMSARGWKMVFVPAAVVYHTHPDSLWAYLKKKYKFAFWRMLAVRKNPAKAVKDSHTPQIMKLQLLFLPLLVVSLWIDLVRHRSAYLPGFVIVAFLFSTIPFTFRAIQRDPVVGPLTPLILALRACAQLIGVVSGFLHTLRKPAMLANKSAA